MSTRPLMNSVYHVRSTIFCCPPLTLPWKSCSRNINCPQTLPIISERTRHRQELQSRLKRWTVNCTSVKSSITTPSTLPLSSGLRANSCSFTSPTTTLLWSLAWTLSSLHLTTVIWISLLRINIVISRGSETLWGGTLFANKSWDFWTELCQLILQCLYITTHNTICQTLHLHVNEREVLAGK